MFDPEQQTDYLNILHVTFHSHSLLMILVSSINQEDVDHLISIMRKKYTFKVDFEAKQYIGIHLDWNYKTRELICSMRNYVKQALMELKHA